MAMVHGMFAQIVFATLVAVAVVTSRAQWREPPPGDRRGLRRVALVVAVATLVQLVFGALVRHQHGPLAQRLHALTAFVVAGAVVWLFWESRAAPEDRPIRRAAGLLVGLVAVQAALGVEAWLRRFGAGVPVELVKWDVVDDAVRSAHYFVGALVFATTVTVNLLLYRPAAAAAAEPAGLLKRPVTGGRFAAGIGGTL
jgi:heme A synthase